MEDGGCSCPEGETRCFNSRASHGGIKGYWLVSRVRCFFMYLTSVSLTLKRQSLLRLGDRGRVSRREHRGGDRMCSRKLLYPLCIHARHIFSFFTVGRGRLPLPVWGGKMPVFRCMVKRRHRTLVRFGFSYHFQMPVH